MNALPPTSSPGRTIATVVCLPSGRLQKALARPSSITHATIGPPGRRAMVPAGYTARLELCIKRRRLAELKSDMKLTAVEGGVEVGSLASVLRGSTIALLVEEPSELGNEHVGVGLEHLEDELAIEHASIVLTQRHHWEAPGHELIGLLVSHHFRGRPEDRELGVHLA